MEKRGQPRKWPVYDMALNDEVVLPWTGFQEAHPVRYALRVLKRKYGWQFFTAGTSKGLYIKRIK